MGFKLLFVTIGSVPCKFDLIIHISFVRFRLQRTPLQFLFVSGLTCYVIRAFLVTLDFNIALYFSFIYFFTFFFKLVTP